MKKKRDLEGKRLYHFELSDKNRTVRWVLVIILLVVAAVAVTVGLLSVLQTPAGWQVVTAASTDSNCSREFMLQYEYGAGKASPTTESKTLERLYGKTTEDAWKLFYIDAGPSNLVGIYEINQHPNEELTVDSSLYLALKQIVDSGSRALYLAPVYAEYDQVFYSDNDNDAMDYDPGQNEDQREYVQTLAEYAKDPQAVQLVLSDNNKVLLQVSQEYLDFAKENELTILVDFGWMRNAFVVDYIAEALIDNGFTNGYIASLDGFTRNLDSRGGKYSLNLFNKSETGVELAAVMDYTAPQSLVFLRSYPMNDVDSWRYYIFEDGRIVTPMIDIADGQSKTATNNLVSYSDKLSCGQLVLSVMPLYVTDTFSEDALNALTEQGIYSVWFNGKHLMHNQENLELTFINSEYKK